MEKPAGFDVSCRVFQAELRDRIAVLRFHRNFLLRTTDLENRDWVLEYLDRVGRSKRVSVLVLVGSPESNGRQEYLDFFKAHHADGGNMIAIHRMYNVISQMVVKIVELEKIVIHINSGYVIAPYLNMGLACDYRILADNAVIQNPCVELGMAPKGGGGLFLPRMVGRRKAYDIMLASRDISAIEAAAMGLIDEVAPVDDLEKTALAKAEDFAARPMETLSGVKKLINYDLKGIRDYMEYENDVLIQIIRRAAVREGRAVM